MTISVVTLLTIMFFHWIADFICQSDWMAKNKSKDIGALSLHVGVYTAWLVFPAIFLFGVKPDTGLEWILVNGVLHWGVDYFTSRASAPLFAKGDYHNGFVVVGFDQFLHLLCLTLSAAYFLHC